MKRPVFKLFLHLPTIAAWLTTVLLSASSGAQDSSDAALRQIIGQVRPDMVVLVRKDQTGADLIEMSAVRGDYPVSLLRSQCQALGKALGSEPRGLAIVQTDPKNVQFNVIKATFAVDGVIDRAQGLLHLGAIVNSVIAAPAPYTVQAITIHFANEAPTAKTLRTYLSDDVALLGTVLNQPTGLEYRVRLLKPNLKSVTIPAFRPPQEKPKTVPPSMTRPNTLLYVLVAVASVAAGALVYFLVLNSGRGSAR